MGPFSREAWEKRAEKLNARKLPGWIIGLPKEVENLNAVKKSLSLEWELIVKTFKEAIQRVPTKNNSDKELSYRFAKETVKLQSQTYKTFCMTYLMRLYLFGEDYSKVSNEVCYQSKNITLLHIASQKRMNEIFTVEKESATEIEFEKNGFEATRTCCGKVQIADRNGKKGVGFIMEERRNFWKIMMKETSQILNLKKVTYNADENKYEFNDFTDYLGNYITTYWPIRLSLANNGSCSMTLNRVSFEKQSNRIIQQISFTS